MLKLEEMDTPFTFEELTVAEKKILLSLEDRYTSDVEDQVRVLPSKFITQRSRVKYVSEVRNFEPRPDDIWLLGFPRSGTTLMQEILFLLGTNFNYERAASEIMDVRFPFMENVFSMPDEQLESSTELAGKDSLSSEELLSLPGHIRLTKTKGRRFVKSHHGFETLNPKLLEVGCKVVFMVRNIKDAFLSLFYYPTWNVSEQELQEKLELFWIVLKENLMKTSNYFHVLKGAWERRDNPNLLILFYEEVNKDKRGAILKVADFLNVKINDEQLNRMVDHIDINNFKKNSSLNNDHLVNKGVYVKNESFSFIRTGKSGGWRDVFTPELNAKFDVWIRENLKDIPNFVMPECWKEAMGIDM